MPKLLGFCLLLALTTAKSKAQTYYFDSCSNHFITYRLLSNKPLLYSVNEYYKNHLLFEGKITTLLQPDIFKHEVWNYNSNDNYFLRDTCIYYNYDGIKLRMKIFGQFEAKESWHYEYDKLTYYCKRHHNKTRTEIYYSKKSTITIEWHKNKVKNYSILYPSGAIENYTYSDKKWLGHYNYYCKQKNQYATIDIEAEGDNIISGTLTDMGNGRIKIINYNGPDEITNELVFIKRRKKNTSYSLYDDHSYYNSSQPVYIKTFYHDGTPRSFKHFNSKGELVSLETFAGKDKYSEAQIEQSYYIRLGNRLKYFNSLSRGEMRYENGIVTIRDTSNNPLKPNIIYYKIDTGGMYCRITGDDNTKLIQSSKGFTLKDLENPDPLFMSDEIQYYNYLLESMMRSYHQVGYYYPFYGHCPHDTTYIGSDTILILKCAPVPEYHILTKNKSLLIHRFSTGEYLAKDQMNCTMGLKSRDSQWLIPPVYEHLVRISLNSTYNMYAYRASTGNTGSLFDNEGHLLIPPSNGFSQSEIRFSKDFCRKHNLLTDLGFIINNKEKDSFYILTPFNTIIIKGNGMLLEQNSSQFAIISKIGRGYLDGNGCHISPIYTAVKNKAPYLLIYQKTEDNHHFYYQLHNRKGEILNNTRFYSIDELEYDYVKCTGKDNWLLYNAKGQLFTENNQYKLNTTYFKDHRIFILSKNNYYGLMNLDLEITVPVRFEAIQIYRQCIFANTTDSTYIFSRTGAILSATKKYTMAGHSFKNNVQFFDYSQYSYTDKKHKTVMAFIIVSQNGYGIIDEKGQLIADMIYSDIGSDKLQPNNVSKDFYWHYNPIFVLVKNGIAKKYCIEDGQLKAIPPTNEVWFFSSHISQKTHLILPSGSISIKNITYQAYKKSFQLRHYNIYKDTSVSVFLGICDIYGDWQLRLDQYSSSMPVGDNYYIKTKDGKAAVINCKGEFIIKPEYEHISYDFENNLLWYKNTGNTTKTYWQLKNLTTGYIATDSFDYPVRFEKSSFYSPYSKNHMKGVINFKGIIELAPTFNQVLYKNTKGTAMLFKKGDEFHVWYSGLAKPIRQPYTTLLSGYNNDYAFGLNGTMLYRLNSQFIAVDSTDNFHLKQPYKMEQWPELYKLVDKEKTVVNQIKRNINFVLNLPRVRNYNSDYISALPWFPDNSSGHPSAGQFNYYNPPTATNYTKSAFQPFTIVDIIGHELYKSNESHNTMSMVGRYDRTGYINILIDTGIGIIQFTLTDIIEKNAIDSFTHLLQSKWQALENPAIPCVQNKDIFRFFERQFIIMEDSFFFNIGGTGGFHIKRNEMAGYMKSFWKDRLK